MCRPILGPPDVDIWVSDNDTTFSVFYTARAAIWLTSRVRLISDIGEDCKEENVFAKLSIRSVISKKRLCYSPRLNHRPSVWYIISPCSVRTASRQKIWRWSTTLERIKLIATNEVHDTLHLQCHTGRCVFVRVAGKKCKQPGNTKYRELRLETCVKPNFASQNWWRIVNNNFECVRALVNAVSVLSFILANAVLRGNSVSERSSNERSIIIDWSEVIIFLLWTQIGA